MNVTLGELTLMLPLELGRLICQDRSAMRMLSMRAPVEDCLIGIVDANYFIGLIDPLAWGGTPAIENWYFLSHVLTGLGTAEGKLLFLDTLPGNDSSLRYLLLHHHSIVHWDCGGGHHHWVLLLYEGAIAWTCSCLYHLRLVIGILLSRVLRRYLALI
jgi:hypothetical protein